jgi:hypothetical protein
MEMVVCEVWMLIDESGDYVASVDPAELGDRWEEEIGERDSSVQTRVVKVTVNVPKPKPVELVATVADLPAGGVLEVA